MAKATKEPLKAHCYVDAKHFETIKAVVRRTVGITLTYNTQDVCFELPADATKAEQRRTQDLMTGFATAISLQK